MNAVYQSVGGALPEMEALTVPSRRARLAAKGVRLAPPGGRLRIEEIVPRKANSDLNTRSLESVRQGAT